MWSEWPRVLTVAKVQARYRHGPGLSVLDGRRAKFVEAAVARLIPADDLGPGAKEAGAALFIDRQLLSAYGAGDA